MVQLGRAGFVALLGASLLFCAAPRASVPPPAEPPAQRTAAAEVKEEPAPPPVDLDDRWSEVDIAIRAAIEDGRMPGCVLVVGRRDEILLERAYGSRALVPEKTPMTMDTVFDLASLTKPIATAMSVMILAERGKIDLGAPAARYVPELGKLPPFTVEHLLLHTSGLPAGLPVADFTDRTRLFRRIGDLRLKSAPGEKYIYTDVGFVVLEEIVRRVSGQGLDEVARTEIFEPLGMHETTFLPPEPLRMRAAPTEMRDGALMKGDVHDPRAFALGGVAGHAGLFSTAADLARFAQAMLGKGTLGTSRVFSEKTFARMSARRQTPGGGRALGWDVDTTSHKSALLSARAFGHGGFTGTALWIDPERDLFFVFLSNRVHPDGHGVVNPLVARLGTLVVQALDVSTGIDVLRAEGFERLDGAKVALVTNTSARAKDGATTIDVLRNAPGVTLSVILSPEHGVGAKREGKIADTTYQGIPVHSLYGERLTPDDEALAGADTLVVDLQDAGVRFYTYASTMKRAMRVAADRNMRVVVLDRPNPLGGEEVAGPVLVPDGTSFVNHHALALRHGMTMGELAMLFAADEKMPLRLDVVRAKNWRRRDTFDRTGLVWVAPSPNLRTVDEVMLYPAIGLLEASNVSVGRGTDTPFELFAAPWLDADAVVKKLEAEALPGVAFSTDVVTPASSVHAGKRCPAVRVRITDRTAFRAVRTGIAIAEALHAVHPVDWDFEKLDKMLVHRPAMEAIAAGKPVAEVEATWAKDLDAFRAKRAGVLLYP